jgi:hypothetical protein
MVLLCQTSGVLAYSWSVTLSYYCKISNATTTLQKHICIKMQCQLDAAEEEELDENADPSPVAAESDEEDKVVLFRSFRGARSTNQKSGIPRKLRS